MLEKLKRMYLIYRNKCGRKNLFMKHQEEFLYCLTRKGVENVNKNVLRGNINIYKINDAVQNLIAFGSEEDFRPIDPSIKLPQPEDVKICLKMLKNEGRIE